MAERHGYTYVVKYMAINGEPRGVLTRVMDAHEHVVVLSRLRTDERLSPTVLTDMCRRTQIPTSAFGLTLTDSGFTFDLEN